MPGDEVEERRLAGAVRPDHAHDLALVDVRGRASRRREAAEGHRHAAQLEQLAPRAHTISTRFSPRSPCGRAIIIATRSAPSTMYRVGSGCGEHHVLPDERGEVERRHEQRDARPSRGASVSSSTSATSPMYVTGGIQPASSARARSPSRSPSSPSSPAAARRPRRPGVVDRPRRRSGRRTRRRSCRRATTASCRETRNAATSASRTTT